MRVKLDVGGKHFSVAKSTLLSVEGSFFHSLFSGKFNVEPEIDGCYFIDRDPEVFHLILSYLRGYKLEPFFMLQKKILDMLQFEAEFYQIQGILDLIPENIYCSFELKATRKDNKIAHDNLQNLVQPLLAISIPENVSLVSFYVSQEPISTNKHRILKWDMMKNGNCGWGLVCFDTGELLGINEGKLIHNAEKYWEESVTKESSSHPIAAAKVGIIVDCSNGNCYITFNDKTYPKAFTIDLQKEWCPFKLSF